MAPGDHSSSSSFDDHQTEMLDDERHTLPVLKVTLPADVDEDGHWKLDRRDSGSLFWRRDSVACKTSRIKFRHDVDVREFHPQPEERLLPQDDPEEDDDPYSDNYILTHDMDAGGWLRPGSLRPGNLFGYRRLTLPRKRGAAGADASSQSSKESSMLMSVVCLVAILVTAWLQGSIAPIGL